MRVSYSLDYMACFSLRFGFVLFVALICAGGRAEKITTPSYAAVRDRVVKAYPQQAEEMSNALLVLQQLTEQSATALGQMEAKCGQ